MSARSRVRSSSSSSSSYSSSSSSKKKARKQKNYLDRCIGMMNRKAINTAYASLADERAYGERLIVQIRKKIKNAGSWSQARVWVALAYMLGYQVQYRREKWVIFEIEDHVRQAESRSKSSGPKKPPIGGNFIGDDNVKAALAFYMCYMFRKEENPVFEFLSKDTALLICYYVMQDKIRAVMGA